jgi:hypothetical protein
MVTLTDLVAVGVGLAIMMTLGWNVGLHHGNLGSLGMDRTMTSKGGAGCGLIGGVSPGTGLAWPAGMATWMTRRMLSAGPESGLVMACTSWAAR